MPCFCSVDAKVFISHLLRISHGFSEVGINPEVVE